MRRFFAFAASLIVSGAALAAAPRHPAPTVASFQRDLVNVLALRSQAQPLLGAALLAHTLPDLPDFSNFHALVTRAAKADDAGPAEWWAQLVDCDPKVLDCPNKQALTALGKHDADNAAVWLMALGRAEHDAGKKAVRDMFAKAVAANHYDDYHGVATQALALATAALPPPKTLYDGKHAAANSAAGVRALIVFGSASPQPMPGFQAAAGLCAKSKPASDLRADCLKLANTLVWGSAPLARSLGLHLESTLADNATVREQAKTARRDLTWQVHSFAQLALDTQKQPVLAQKLLQLARSGGTQMSLILAALRAARIPVHAPADWQPHGSKTAKSAGH
ncbi:MAG TPA: hypothetical protein VF271_06150 [Rhodanobacteraceae bacterium]